MLNFYRKTRLNFFWNNFQLPLLDIEEISPNATPVQPVIFDHLCLPPYHGPQEHNDIVPLLTLIDYFKPKTFLEVGTAHGATVANICALSEAKIYTINALPEQLDGIYTTFALTRNEIGCVYREHGFSDRVTQIYLNTWKMDLSPYLDEKTIDFAIIDGCHDTEFVINDFHCVFPYLSPSAVVVFHDVGRSKPEPMYSHLDDGYFACMYLRKMGFNVCLIKNTWWGIWRANNPETPLSLQKVFVNKLDNLFGKRSRTPSQDARLFRFYQNQFLD